MATKLKNTKLPIKIAAFLVAAIMFFFSGYFAELFIRGFLFYNSYSKRSYTQTYSFRYNFNAIERGYLTDVGLQEEMGYDEFLSSAYGKMHALKWDNDVKKVVAAYDLLAASDIEVYVNSGNRYRYLVPYKGLVYVMDSNGTILNADYFFNNSSDEEMFEVEDTEHYEDATTALFTAPETVPEALSSPDVTEIQKSKASFYESKYGTRYYVKDGVEYRFFDPDLYGAKVPLEVHDISNALESIGNIDGYATFGESSKERFVQAVEENKKTYLESIYYSRQDQRALTESAGASIKYAIFYKGVDGVYTNAGVAATDTEEQIVAKLTGGSENTSTFVEGIKGDKYTVFKGEVIEEDKGGVWAELHEALAGSNGESFLQRQNLNNYIMTDYVEAAYFAYVPSDDPADPFNSLRLAFGYYMLNPKPLSFLLVSSIICFMIAFAAVMIIFANAGKTANGIRLSFFDKIPYEITLILALAVMGVAAFAVVGLLGMQFWATNETALLDDLVWSAFLELGKNTHIITGILEAIFFMVWTGITVIFIKNIRNKTFLKHTIFGWLLKPLIWIWKKIKKFTAKQIDRVKFFLDCDYSKGEGKKFKTIAAVSVAAFLLLNGFFVWLSGAWYDAGWLILIFMILVNAAVLLFCLMLISSFDRIAECVARIKNGELNSTIDMSRMPKFMQKFAQDILSMQDGLNNAVESAVKDQRMKAELITNVSHDLKTPLTSIVNYVDLLKKCDVQDETAQKYISVLDEKAARMKKLIEDLVEASKASSGAIDIHPIRINLCEFAAQAVGEHEDELKKFNIGIVLKAPEAPVTVMADSQKTSRIVENLFSNIRKYALDGTRVFVEVYGGAEYGSIVIKNISKYELNVSADELTQRFVRGDASRSGEGSGLGLSIAQNLCELQGGKFRVDTDGDLFKVTVELPKA